MVMGDERRIRTILRVASLPISLSAGVALRLFVGALFGRPAGHRRRDRSRLGLTIRLALSAVVLVAFFFIERR